MYYNFFFKQTRDFSDKEWVKVSKAYAELLREDEPRTLSTEMVVRPELEPCLHFAPLRYIENQDTFLLPKQLSVAEGLYGPLKKGLFRTVNQAYDYYVKAFFIAVDYYAPGIVEFSVYTYTDYILCPSGCQDSACCWLGGILKANELWKIVHLPEITRI